MAFPHRFCACAQTTRVDSSLVKGVLGTHAPDSGPMLGRRLEKKCVIPIVINPAAILFWAG
jgi:hypothetical protein